MSKPHADPTADETSTREQNQRNALFSLSDFIRAESTPALPPPESQVISDMRWCEEGAEPADASLPVMETPAEVSASVRQAVRGAALFGVFTGASSAAARSYRAMMNGDIDRVDYAVEIGVGAVVGGVASAGRSAATLALKTGARSLATRLGAEGLKRVASSNVGTLAAFAVVEQSLDTVHLARGKISAAEYTARSLANAGSFGGGYGGMVAGAALGSALPVVGTVAGAVCGALIGSVSGGSVARRLTDTLRGLPKG